MANANRGRKCADEGCGEWKDDTERTELVVEGGWCCQMAKFDPFLSLDCARAEGVGDQILPSGNFDRSVSSLHPPHPSSAHFRLLFAFAAIRDARMKNAAFMSLFVVDFGHRSQGL